MSTRRISLTLLAVAACALLGTSAADADDIELILLGAGEFKMSDGESEIISDSELIEPYRVCVSKGPRGMSLLVKYDDQQASVAVGACLEVKAKFIKLTPADPLGEDDILVGNYERLR